jgi:acetyl-CoA carboxylase biotin carboxylase subunit
MFRKILIANRGEIALRVICACKELGIPTVAVYSEADRNSLHVRFADEAVCIGPPRSSESYLNIPHVISAAEITNVDAIHPGYGFLSENANFAEVCEASHITLIGPRPELIRLMGEKERARREIAAAGLPVVPGSDGIVENEAEAAKAAKRVGYPLIIKASAGGGGRGMRVVRKLSELGPAFEAARNEAQQAFGTPDVYLEKFLERPRHIEFQVLGDKHGNVLHLGERECSIQRRHQKLIEESPSPVVDEATRSDLGGRVVAALKKIGYTNAGTVEFLRDEDGSFYFIEMNTRIQVEHPVTEMVTNVDLIKSQIRLAAGELLHDAVGPVEFRGHSMECRINAEDPETFVPSAGRITTFHIPSGTGVRVDTAVYADSVIPPYYDSLIAKLITRGRDRAEALARMRRALDMFIVEGIKTSIPLHRRILANADFQAGRLDTHFLEGSGLTPAPNAK